MKASQLNYPSGKKKILQVVVDDYIDDGQPISSKSIQEKHLCELSSATIRSELSQLEEMGYLSQPHTSAGRVPLPKAYRMYVSELMQYSDLSEKEIGFIQSRFDTHYQESEYLVKSAAKIISEMTDYTAVGYFESGEDTIKNIKLVKLSEDTILLILLTELNIIKDHVITTNFSAEEEYIALAEQVLNEELQNKKIKEVAEAEILLSSRMMEFKQLFDDIVHLLKNYVQKHSEDKYVLEGSTNIFKHSEFNDIDKTKNFLAVIDSKQKLSSLLKNSEDLEICVRIGKEEGSELSDDLALVTAQYKLGGKPLGSAGVIGPIRMDYGRVVKVLSMIGRTIGELNQSKETTDTTERRT